jgi:flavin reductase
LPGAVADFVGAMRLVATGVTVVTTDGRGGRLGQTVSAACSVSAEPPIVLACLNSRSPANAAIEANGLFCVNVLATQHDHVADTFAGRPWPGKEPWDFSCGDWTTTPDGLPRLIDAVASFECSVRTVVAIGTHRVYFGDVHQSHSRIGVPLVYSDQIYRQPMPFSPSTFADYPEAGPARIERAVNR